MSDIFAKCWNSPTLTQALNFITTALRGVLVMPLVVSLLEAQQIAVFYLFTTVTTVAALLTASMGSSYTRCMSYAFGGAQSLDLKVRNTNFTEPNHALMNEILIESKKIQVVLITGGVLITVLLGHVMLDKQISLLGKKELDAWGAWYITILFVGITIWLNRPTCLLNGIGKIATVNRFNVLTGVIAVFLTCLLLLCGMELYSFGIAGCITGLLSIYIFSKLLKKEFERGEARKTSSNKKEIFQALWQPAWRQSIIGLLTIGVNRGAGFIAALFLTGATLASYLQGLSMMMMALGISMAPFYSQLPRYNKLRSQGKIEELARSSALGISKALIVFSIACVGISISVPIIFKLVGSNIEFLDSRIWFFMSVVWFFERYHGMQAQVYITSNNIPFVPHQLFTGALKISLMYLLGKEFGVIGIIVAHGLANLVIMNWVTTLYSLRSLKGFAKSQLKAIAPSFVLSLSMVFLILFSKEAVDFLSPILSVLRNIKFY